MFNKRRIKIEACLITLLSFMFLSAAVFGQGVGASLTGTVQDSSGGVVPGASIIARNVDTGVETRMTSNDRGSYTFPSLQVGTYTITAEASGFSRAARNDVRLNVGGQVRLDFTLAVAGTVTEVSVTGTADSVILEAGASTGTVLQEETLASIPLLSNSLMDLINIMGGVTPAADPVFSANSQTFAGVTAQQINVTRDGMSVTEVRNPTGIAASTNINQEMVGEFRMILSPVDAEMGRGAGQVQMTTRSGSNAYHGSAVWSNQNTALDAQDFSNKANNNPKSWRNLNDYMLTASGPIVRNRTFFFATWEHQIARDRQLQNLKVLTPCARKGIFRYIKGWTNAAISANGTYDPNSFMAGATLQSVLRNEDAAWPGQPITEMKNNLTFYNVNDLGQSRTFAPGELKLGVESVFGNLLPDVRTALLADHSASGIYGDCSSISFAPAANPGLSLSGTNVGTGLYGNGFIQPNTYWGGAFSSGLDTGGVYRNAYDPTGFVGRFTFGADYANGRVEMPPANYYGTGDGLNYAAHQWYNPIVGAGASIYGTGGDPDRKSFTIKLDHNINNDHRLSGTYTYEQYYVDDGYRQWPESFGGYGAGIDRKPQNIMVSLTSTLRPTLLNEARFGLSSSDTWTTDPYDNARNGSGEKMKSVLEALLPREWANGEIPVVGVGDSPVLFHTDPQSYYDYTPSHPFGSRGNISTTWGGSDPRWTIADTVTWMKGSHSFKGGVEYRRQSSSQEFVGNRGFAGGGGFVDHAAAFGGLTSLTGPRRGSKLAAADGAWSEMGGGWNNLMNSYSGNYSAAWGLMSYFSGSINQVRQYYFGVPDASSPTGARWNDTANGENLFIYNVANQELSFFFKDDWKVTKDLTLNLGVRYEYYGVPYVKDGKTLKLKGLSSENVFGITNGGWDNWMSNRDQFYVPAKTATFSGMNGTTIALPAAPAPVSGYEYIGPGSSRPDVMAWNRDMNNFAPHLGFAWQLPWFGRGMTTLRGGWSVSYSPVDNFNQYGIYVGDIGGISYLQTFTGTTGDSMVDNGYSQYYMDLTDLRSILNSKGYLPAPTSVLPLPTRVVGGVDGWATALDENLRNPYTHSFNMSLTRNIGRSLTVDVRYIGTMGRNQLMSNNINSTDYLYNGMYQELMKVRKGGESALINSLIPQYTLLGNGFDYATFQPIYYPTGSDQVRNAAGFSGTGSGSAAATQSNLISGSFSGIVGTLATTNGEMVPLGGMTTTTAGLLQRSGCLPGDRPGYLQAFAGNPRVDVSNFPCAAATPYNYFYANPQYASATLYYNGGMSNYHSMQTQVTLRPTHGLNFQATWTWSRALGNSGYTDYSKDRISGRDYLLSGQHRSHTLNTYGSWDLPFGTNGFFFRDASGVFKKAIEGWQLSWVTQMSTGSPSSISGSSTLWGRSWPNLVRPDLWEDKAGHAEWTWTDQGSSGLYFGNKYTNVVDYNICNNQKQNSPGYLSDELFRVGCMAPNGSGVWTAVGSAPRALAIASNQVDSSGVTLPQRYGSLEEALKYDPYAMMEMAPDGTYSLNPSIVIFRSANQWDGFNASGNYQPSRITGQGRFSFDLAMTKAIEFMEGKRFEIRVDAQNILNHATPTNGTGASYGGRFMSIANPNFAFNSFGNISTKAGHRTFQARLALRF